MSPLAPTFGYATDSDKGVCCHHSSSVYILYELDRRQSQANRRMCHYWELQGRMLFADDLVLLVSSHQDLQHALDQFSVACNQAGSKTSDKKQGVMCL